MQLFLLDLMNCVEMAFLPICPPIRYDCNPLSEWYFLEKIVLYFVFKNTIYI